MSMIELLSTPDMTVACGTPVPGITSSNRYRVLLIGQGSGSVSLSGRVAEVAPGAVMLLAPYDLLYVPADGAHAWEGYLFTFTSDALYRTDIPLLEVFRGETYRAPAQLSEGVLSLVRRVGDIATAPEAHRLPMARLSMTELLLRLAASPLSADDTLGVARAARYLAAHMHEDVSLDELSSAVGISKFYLCRAFSRDSGLTPHAYLNHLRAYRAETLLAGGMSAADVAISVGFGDYSTFFRTYRKIIGRTPTTRDSE